MSGQTMNGAEYSDFEEGFRLELYLQGLEKTANVGQYVRGAWQALKKVPRGIANAPAALPRYLAETGKAQVWKSSPLKRIGGKFTHADDILEGLAQAKHGTSASKLASSERKALIDSLKKAREQKAKAGWFGRGTSYDPKGGDIQIGRLGNIYHKARGGAVGSKLGKEQIKERTIYGLPEMARNMVSPKAWRQGFNETFPGETVGQRVWGGIKSNAPLVGLYGALTPLEDRDDYKQFAMSAVPSLLAGNVMSRLGGKRYGQILPHAIAYGAGEAILNKNPMLRRPYGLQRDDIASLADSYGVPFAEMSNYLRQQEASEKA